MTEKLGNHIVQYPAEYSLCLGCQSCDLVCSLIHDGVTGPAHGRIKMAMPDFKQLRFQILACQQCAEHPCYDACPKKGHAMCIDKQGIVYIQEEFCVGCGLCARACRYTPSRITLDQTEHKARKCDLCRERPGGPACVEYCPVRCLGLSDDPQPGGSGTKEG
jgi:Fe-S-cluster-containing hydrogenase component 2